MLLVTSAKNNCKQILLRDNTECSVFRIVQHYVTVHKKYKQYDIAMLNKTLPPRHNVL